MNDPIRSRIRDDVLSGYEEPAPDLTRRALTVLVSQRVRRRSNLQVLALSAALVLVAAAVLVARGTHLLPISQDASSGAGLRPPAAPYSIVDNRFISASTGWILVQMHTTSGPTVLLKTSDGGAHWVEQFRYSGPGGIDSIDFSRNGRDGTMAWREGGATLSAPGEPVATPSPTVIKTYATHDGGIHWKVISSQLENNPPKSSPQPAYYPGGPDFYLDNRLEGWQVRMPSNQQLSVLIMHTTDGGNIWTQIGALPAGSGGGSVYFFDSKNGWYVVGDSRSFAFDGQGRPLPEFAAGAHQFRAENLGRRQPLDRPDPNFRHPRGRRDPLPELRSLVDNERWHPERDQRWRPHLVNASRPGGWLEPQHGVLGHDRSQRHLGTGRRGQPRPQHRRRQDVGRRDAADGSLIHSPNPSPLGEGSAIRIPPPLGEGRVGASSARL
ncbi:MAG: hypothetical protein E6I56_13075 [Chloroflexi bacterium]|nr:MAG: hypothetical protein E6I56_13075 [Chloroflexota bacterium]